MTDDERPLMANIPPFGLRMQAELKSRIEAAARENNRSMNAEIVDRLEASFTAEKDVERLAKMVEKVGGHLKMADAATTAIYYDEDGIVREARAANEILASLVESGAIADKKVADVLATAFGSAQAADRQELLRRYARLISERRQARDAYTDASAIVEGIKSYLGGGKFTVKGGKSKVKGRKE